MWYRGLEGHFPLKVKLDDANDANDANDDLSSYALM